MTTELISIDKTLADCVYRIELAQTSTVWNVIEIGKALSEAREAIRQDPERCFYQWAKSVRISKSGAYRAIAVYERFGDRPTLGRLEVSEAYMLAMDGVPDEAIDQAIEESQKKGEPLGRPRIQEIKDEHRVAAVRPPGESDDGADESEGDCDYEGESPACDGVQRREVAEATGERASDALVKGGRGSGASSGDGEDVDDREPAPRAKAPKESNVIGDRTRQITMECEFATDGLADYEVAAIYEKVRLWMAADLEKRGMKP